MYVELRAASCAQVALAAIESPDAAGSGGVAMKGDEAGVVLLTSSESRA